MPAAVTTPFAHRLPALDALRGPVIVIMTLDHVRDFLHAGAMMCAGVRVRGGSRALFPPDFGYPLWITYAAWIAVLLMYPLCRWCAAVKARRSDWWLGYL